MEKPYGLTVRLWVECVCPYLSLPDIQYFRLCSKSCKSIIHQSLPVYISLLQSIETGLQTSPLLQLEDEEYNSQLSQRATFISNSLGTLNVLNPSELDRIKRMRKLTPAVLDSVNLINLLLHFPKSDQPCRHWGTNFLSNLCRLDPARVTKKEHQALKKYVEKWEEEEVAKASAACRYLYIYLAALEKITAPDPPRPMGIRTQLERVRRDVQVVERLAMK